MKLRKAFSLIEMLIAGALVALLLVTANSILFNSLKSARKSEAIAIAKNEGSYALTNMTRMIRFAESGYCFGSNPSNTLQVVTISGETMSFIYDSANQKIASNSAGISVDLTTTSVDVSVPASPCNSFMFSCTGRVINICFAVDSAKAFDTSDSASTVGTGIIFQDSAIFKNQQ